MVGLYKGDSLDEFAVSGLRACANIAWDALHAPPSVCRLLDLRSFWGRGTGSRPLWHKWQRYFKFRENWVNFGKQVFLLILLAHFAKAE